MAISKPKTGKSKALASEADIDRVIEAGGGVSGQVDKPAVRPDVKFQMVIPADLCDRIDADRAPSKTSRRAWLLQRTLEYFDNNIHT